jgi:hypothetical protein
LSQNEFAHLISGQSLLDKIPTKKKFREQNMLSSNQINSQGHEYVVWKSLNILGYPTQWEIRNAKTDSRTRSRDKLSLIEPGRSKIMTSVFFSNAAKL